MSKHGTPNAVIGLDVGGSAIRAGLVDDMDTLRRRAALPTRPDWNTTEFVEQLVALVDAVGRGEPSICASAAGVALPGLLDERRKSVVRSVNLPFLEGDDLRSRLAEAFGFPIELLTDIDAATLAEHHVAGDPADTFVHLRIGTGVGCGVLVNQRSVALARSVPGHADVLVVDDRPDARPCPCGRRGCLEAYVSGAAIARQLDMEGLDWTMPSLGEAYERGEPAAVRMLDAAAGWLMQVFGSIILACEPRWICLGGGVIEHCPVLAEIVRTRFAHEQKEMQRDVELVMARCGDDAGIIGAARHARFYQNRQSCA